MCGKCYIVYKNIAMRLQSIYPFVEVEIDYDSVIETNAGNKSTITKI